MLVRPGHVVACFVRDAKDRVYPYEIPWEYRGAVIERIANQLVWVDGIDSAVAVDGADSVDAIQILLPSSYSELVPFA